MDVFFLYFQVIPQCPSTLRYIDHQDTVHEIEGRRATGRPPRNDALLLDNPPHWGRVMARSPQDRAVAFADDGFVYDSLSSAPPHLGPIITRFQK